MKHTLSLRSKPSSEYPRVTAFSGSPQSQSNVVTLQTNHQEPKTVLLPQISADVETDSKEPAYTCGAVNARFACHPRRGSSYGDLRLGKCFYPTELTLALNDGLNSRSQGPSCSNDNRKGYACPCALPRLCTPRRRIAAALPVKLVVIASAARQSSIVFSFQTSSLPMIS